MTAEIAYGRSPTYERWHPDSLGYSAVDIVVQEAREARQADAETQGPLTSSASVPMASVTTS